MSKWIDFEPMPVSKGRKTLIWNVVTKGAMLSLGSISWFARWRKYAFFPNTGTLYEQTCLRDIAQFIDEQMTARRKP